MIELIGFMIGTYIFTRMIELVMQKTTSGFLTVCCIITLIVVCISMMGLLFNDLASIRTLPH